MARPASSAFVDFSKGTKFAAWSGVCIPLARSPSAISAPCVPSAILMANGTHHQASQRAPVRVFARPRCCLPPSQSTCSAANRFLQPAKSKAADPSRHLRPPRCRLPTTGGQQGNQPASPREATSQPLPPSPSGIVGKRNSEHPILTVNSASASPPLLPINPKTIRRYPAQSSASQSAPATSNTQHPHHNNWASLQSPRRQRGHRNGVIAS